ncbi:MAG: winged helix-turn-helix transcriptional regulator [Nitrospirae bacterium]|nr:winged helix-turn-helix transcriptional regulator [Nitrospirota bacterium]
MNESVALKLFDEIEREPNISQRVLAARIGIALGLVNVYIKKFYQKGYIKLKNLPRNRIRYIITPEGFVEKTKLTYSYICYSVNCIKNIRCKIENTYLMMLSSGIIEILIWGDSEIAELCYISSRGLPIKIVGVVGESKINNGFFGYNVYSIESLGLINFDAILVASIEDKVIKFINQQFINRYEVYYLL